MRLLLIAPNPGDEVLRRQPSGKIWCHADEIFERAVDRPLAHARDVCDRDRRPIVTVTDQTFRHNPLVEQTLDRVDHLVGEGAPHQGTSVVLLDRHPQSPAAGDQI